MSEDRRDEMVELQKEFSSLYSETGLISVDDNRIHVTEKTFRDLFDDWEEKTVGETKRLVSYYKDTKFFCIT